MAAIGVLTLELHLDGSHSLKEKRQVVKGLQDRLRSRFNVAVAEVDHQETWQRATLSAVTVASARLPAERVLRSVEEEAWSMVGAALVGSHLEWIE